MKGPLLCLALAAAAALGWARPTTPPTRWILAYAGWPKQGRSAYTVDDFVRELAVVDSAGSPLKWLSTGVILTQVSATSGRGFYPGFGSGPADGADWSQYVDSIVGPGGAVARLDSAAALVQARVPGGPGRVPVAIVIPYPDTGSRTVKFGDSSYDMSTTEGRFGLVQGYLSTIKKSFSQERFGHLRLDAFYWLRENCYPFDTMLVKQAAQRVHQDGLRFLWVPYFRSYNFQHWRGLGFDESWLQPNYFFHPEVGAGRIDSAIAMAKTNRMGMEVELDRRLLTNPQFSDRLDPYLTALQGDSTLRSQPVVIFDGAGAIIDLSKSPDPKHRSVYRRLTAALTGVGGPRN